MSTVGDVGTEQIERDTLSEYHAQAATRALAALPAAFAGAFVTHRFQFVGMPAFALENSTLPLTIHRAGEPRPSIQSSPLPPRTRARR